MSRKAKKSYLTPPTPFTLVPLDHAAARLVKTMIPMSPKILEHPSASTEPFPKQVFERVFNEKLNSI